MNRQKMFLLILLVLLVAAAIYAYFRMPQQQSAERGGQAPVTPAEPAKREMARDDRKLHLELLDRPVPKFAGFKRNIFSHATYETRKRLPLPPPPPPPPPPSRPAALPPPPPPSPVKTEMAKFTFLGFLNKDNRKTVFLAKDNEIFLVRKGDKIAGKYEVTNITDGALTISTVAGEGQVVIPLVENLPLAAPR